MHGHLNVKKVDNSYRTELRSAFLLWTYISFHPVNTVHNTFNSGVSSELLEAKKKMSQLKSWRPQHQSNRLTCHSIDSAVYDVLTSTWPAGALSEFPEPAVLTERATLTRCDHAGDAAKCRRRCLSTCWHSRLKSCILRTFHFPPPPKLHTCEFLPMNSNSTS